MKALTSTMVSVLLKLVLEGNVDSTSNKIHIMKYNHCGSSSHSLISSIIIFLKEYSNFKSNNCFPQFKWEIPLKSRYILLVGRIRTFSSQLFLKNGLVLKSVKKLPFFLFWATPGYTNPLDRNDGWPMQTITLLRSYDKYAVIRKTMQGRLWLSWKSKSRKEWCVVSGTQWGSDGWLYACIYTQVVPIKI